MDQETINTDMNDLYQRFEALIINLLDREGYTEVQSVGVIVNNQRSPTIISKTPNGAPIAIVLKLYRSAAIQNMMATFAIRNLDKVVSVQQTKNGLLILTGNLPQTYKESIDFENSKFKIWDLNDLRARFKKYDDLEQAFIELMNELQPFKEAAEPVLKTSSVKKNKTLKPVKEELSVSDEIQIVLKKEAKRSLDAIIKSLPQDKGSRLADEIRMIPSGKPNATLFERKITEALKYLFSNDLSAWKEQNKTTEELHRFDLIARITSSSSEFWRMLESHFRAKYVIFEHKNYTDQITQKEIYTTEKYLYLPAMRTVAIIISPLGAEENALKAARGALREHGKVILNLSVATLCEMLVDKDNGGNPSNQMITILDDMLMQIER